MSVFWLLVEINRQPGFYIHKVRLLGPCLWLIQHIAFKPLFKKRLSWLLSKQLLLVPLANTSILNTAMASTDGLTWCDSLDIVAMMTSRAV